MKILMLTRPCLGEFMTGDVTQIQQTAAALRRQGITVDISSAMQPDTTGYDVVHLFDTLNPELTYQRMRYLAQKNIPMALSTIYWEWLPEELKNESLRRLGPLFYGLSRCLDALRPRLPDRLRYRLDQSDLPYPQQQQVYALQRTPGRRSMLEHLFSRADVLLPNSVIEYDYLVDRFGIHNDYVAVPNAINPDMQQGDAKAFVQRFGLRDFILCTAVVCVRKNQIRLIEAANRLNVPLLLVGRQEPKYTARCRAIAGPNIHFIGQLQGQELKNAFAAARVHALVSFYETPGLASLEAALCNSAIVATDRGCPREYFEEQAFYCQPNDVDGIEQALRQALDTGPNPTLKQHILDHYTWEHTAQATLEGYRKAIKKHAKIQG